MQPVASRPLELRVPAAGLAAGSYTVTWRIVSAVDGHRTEGSSGSGPARPAPRMTASQSVAAVRAGPALGPLAVTGRWAWYWGVALLVGAAATGLLVFGGRLPGRPVLLLGSGHGGRGGRPGRDDRGRPGRRRGWPRRPARPTTGRWLLWRAAMLAAAGAAVGWLLARPRLTPRCWPSGWPAGPGCWCTRWPGTRPVRRRCALNLLAQWTHLLAVGVWIGGLAWLFAGSGATPRPGRPGRWCCASPSWPASAWPWWWSPAWSGRPTSWADGGGWSTAGSAGRSTSSCSCSPGWWGWGRSTATGWCRCSRPARGAGPRPAAAQRRRRAGAGGGRAGRRGPAQPAGPGRPDGPGRRRRPHRSWRPRADWATTVRVTLTVTPGAAGPNRFTATVADFDTGAVLPADRVELTGTPASHPDLAGARLELARRPTAAGSARAACCPWPAAGTSPPPSNAPPRRHRPPGPGGPAPAPA